MPVQKWEYVVHVCRHVSVEDPDKKGFSKWLSEVKRWEWDDSSGLTQTIDERLNQLGRDGWELVSESVIASSEAAPVNGVKKNWCTSHRFFFKRLLS